MVGWHHRLKGHELEQTLGDSEGQGSLVCCSPWEGGLLYGRSHKHCKVIILKLKIEIRIQMEVCDALLPLFVSCRQGSA